MVKGQGEDKRRQLGREGEDAAVSYLLERGFDVLARNYHTPFGELDIVARTEGTVALVEVKTGRAGATIDPRTRFTPAKVSRMFNASYYYLEKEFPGEDVDVRFDFIVVVMRGDRCDVEHFEAVAVDKYLPPDAEE
jgi:putative endonuclease